MNTTSKVALTTANKDAERSNLNGKVEYLSLALPLNTLFLLLVFIGYLVFLTQNHHYYCASDRQCWFALRMELYVLCRRRDEYS